MELNAPVRRLRILAVQLSLGTLAVCAILAYAMFGQVVAQGLLLGGLSGTLAFWLLARNLEKVATQGVQNLPLQAARWTVVRMVIYGLALGRAYFLDRETYHGLIAAVVGLFVIRGVMIFLAFTGWDLEKQRGD